MYFRKLLLLIFFIMVLSPLARSFAAPGNTRLQTDYHQKQLIREWMHALAFDFFKDPEPVLPSQWHSTNRDCSGFIRYLVWQSIRTHDHKWQRYHGSALTRALPDVFEKPVSYAVYRNKNRSYSNFADSFTLMRYNSRLITRQIDSSLRDADILFFEDGNSYHSMLLLRNRLSGGWFVVYHTGNENNQLKILDINNLFEHTQKKWHPSDDNPHFLGFYRLYFLDEENSRY